MGYFKGELKMGAIYKNFQTKASTKSETVYNMSFKNCIEYIRKMDTMTKAEVSAEINVTLKELYLQADRYGNEDLEACDRIDTAMFVHIMGVIKKWETLLYWLFEIDILMGEDEISRKLQAAEERMNEVDWDTESYSVRFVKGEDGKNHKALVNDNNYYMDLVAQKYDKSNQAHTDDIISMAEDLCKKYF